MGNFWWFITGVLLALAFAIAVIMLAPEPPRSGEVLVLTPRNYPVLTVPTERPSVSLDVLANITPTIVTVNR